MLKRYDVDQEIAAARLEIKEAERMEASAKEKANEARERLKLAKSVKNTNIEKQVNLHAEIFRICLRHAVMNNQTGRRSSSHPQFVVARGSDISNECFVHTMQAGAHVWPGQVYFDTEEAARGALEKVSHWLLQL